MRIRKTKRGSKIGKFDDYYGQKCSIQKSSVASKSCIWLGIDSIGPYLSGPSGHSNEGINARMILDIKMAKELIKRLQKFADTGDL